jgi:hypothetical protein
MSKVTPSLMKYKFGYQVQQYYKPDPVILTSHKHSLNLVTI